MSLFRILFLGLLLYFGFKLLSSISRSLDRRHNEVHGSDKGKPPLDLNDEDVEDADFEEIK